VRPLFSEPGLQRLGEIVRPGMLCVFDFDGTLSPIVARPEEARLPAEVLERMTALMRHASVAIITGRSVADIRERLGFEPHYMAGNHGLEGIPGWEKRGAQYEQDCRAWKDTLSAALRDASRFEPGISVEDKRYSLSVHYRAVHDRTQAAIALRRLFAEALPEARVIDGKCVFNVVPRGAADKGMALEQMIRSSGAPSALYVGDDVTDEDAFRLRRPDLLTVRIEPAAGSAADFFLPHYPDIVPFLDELIGRLRGPDADADPAADKARA
jgi:trehalose 6-phosphate phosphatase